jgi:hypothetical protein
VAERLASVVGGDNVAAPASKTIRGLRAPVEVYPGDEQQLAEVMRLATPTGWRCVSGGRDQARMGQQTAGARSAGEHRPSERDRGPRSRRPHRHGAGGRMATALRDEVAGVRRILPLYSARRGPATVGGVISTVCTDCARPCAGDSRTW